MNRPNYIDYVRENRGIQEYTKELEKYCDGLEEKNIVLIEGYSLLFKENEKLVKALHDVCKYLANPWTCKVFNRNKRMWSYLDWKVWAFKDEK